jgi:hypothetical protein
MHNSNIYSYITTQELLEQIIDVLTTLSKEEVVNCCSKILKEIEETEKEEETEKND